MPTMSLRVNATAIRWDDLPGRKKLPCVKCGAKTRGRAFGLAKTGQPFCIGHAIDVVFDKAFSLVGRF